MLYHALWPFYRGPRTANETVALARWLSWAHLKEGFVKHLFIQGGPPRSWLGLFSLLWKGRANSMTLRKEAKNSPLRRLSEAGAAEKKASCEGPLCCSIPRGPAVVLSSGHHAQQTPFPPPDSPAMNEIIDKADKSVMLWLSLMKDSQACKLLLLHEINKKRSACLDARKVLKLINHHHLHKRYSYSAPSVFSILRL